MAFQSLSITVLTGGQARLLKVSLVLTFSSETYPFSLSRECPINTVPDFHLDIRENPTPKIHGGI